MASTEFVPIADNCSLLQSQQDAEGDFFRLVAEQGHYGGRTVPSNTRQGQYACTADGQFLASCNTREAGPMLQMMRHAGTPCSRPLRPPPHGPPQWIRL